MKKRGPKARSRSRSRSPKEEDDDDDDEMFQETGGKARIRYFVPKPLHEYMATIEGIFREYVLKKYNSNFDYSKKENYANIKVDDNKHFIEVTCKKPTYLFVQKFYPDTANDKQMISKIFYKIQVDGKKVTVYKEEFDEDRAEDAKKYINILNQPIINFLNKIGRK